MITNSSPKGPPEFHPKRGSISSSKGDSVMGDRVVTVSAGPTKVAPRAVPSVKREF
ncbi:unnamed protein product, partial [Gulo gulo]